MPFYIESLGATIVYRDVSLLSSWLLRFSGFYYAFSAIFVA